MHASPSRTSPATGFAAPDRPVYSNLDAAPYPFEPSVIARRLGDHLANPVRFADMIAAMYRDGARVFVEVGPGAILGPMVGLDLERSAPPDDLRRYAVRAGPLRLSSDDSLAWWLPDCRFGSSA